MSSENDQPSDPQLIQQTLAGDQEAYARLVEKYQKKIYRVAFVIVRNEIDADGVTQDTFVQAYFHLGKFEGRSEFETWLTRIAINKSRDLLRSRRWHLFSRPEPEPEEPTVLEPADTRPDPERLAGASELMEAIERAVEKLPSQQRTIFRLRHYEELPLDEIATLMDLRPGTVRAHLFRAIRKIRKELEVWLPIGAVPEGSPQ